MVSCRVKYNAALISSAEALEPSRPTAMMHGNSVLPLDGNSRCCRVTLKLGCRFKSSHSNNLDTPEKDIKEIQSNKNSKHVLLNLL